jgi:hypothetical protein
MHEEEGVEMKGSMVGTRSAIRQEQGPKMLMATRYVGI